jgi:DNA-binding MarR family transcriptional regulator
MTTAKDRPIDIMARTCVAVRLRLLNRLITNLYDEAMRPLGLKVSQLNIMVATAKLELAHPARVCALLELDASTLSRNVDRMRTKGWLEIVPGEDARTQPFRLTAAGQKLLDRAFPLWEQAQENACDLLDREGVELLTRMERKLGMFRPKS